MTGDPGADGIDVPVHLRVVGRFIAGQITVNKYAREEENDDADCEPDAKTRVRSRELRTEIPRACRQWFCFRPGTFCCCGRWFLRLRRDFHSTDHLSDIA